MHTSNIVKSYPKVQSRKGNEMILIHLFFNLFLYEIFIDGDRKYSDISYRAKFWIKVETKVSHNSSKVIKKYVIHINLESHKDKTNRTSKTQSENAQLE